MSFNKEELQEELHTLVQTPSTNIDDFPRDITASLLEYYKPKSQGFKILVQTNLVQKQLKGSVKSVSAALYDSDTDGVTTVHEELTIDRKDYVVIVTLIYVKT